MFGTREDSVSMVIVIYCNNIFELIVSLGAACRNRHVKKVPCAMYLIGFCPRGPTCELAHPKFDIPLGQER